ncbi:unnamed protein product [Ceutorhynchus assimilis]|uniref:Uncharacterized protein n=1 Tax=Ceutorhynchus assimilis TaxID=467358 RepID=A0A9N9MS35_9CUCU|nr:unnamed protein product [Ceutorhynchus assimilis]
MDYKICDETFQKAQNDFKNCLLDTIDSINFSKIKLSKAQPPLLPNYKLKEPATNPCNHDRLRKSVLKSQSSIKRSLMTINNIVHQWNLLILPYQELRALSGQFIEHENFGKSSNRDYLEAVRCLKEVLDEIKDVESKTGKFFDDFQYFDDEYKNLPSGN